MKEETEYYGLFWVDADVESPNHPTGQDEEQPIRVVSGHLCPTESGLEVRLFGNHQLLGEDRPEIQGLRGRLSDGRYFFAPHCTRRSQRDELLIVVCTYHLISREPIQASDRYNQVTVASKNLASYLIQSIPPGDRGGEKSGKMVTQRGMCDTYFLPEFGTCSISLFYGSNTTLTTTETQAIAIVKLETHLDYSTEKCLENIGQMLDFISLFSACRFTITSLSVAGPDKSASVEAPSFNSSWEKPSHRHSYDAPTSQQIEDFKRAIVAWPKHYRQYSMSYSLTHLLDSRASSVVEIQFLLACQAAEAIVRHDALPPPLDKAEFKSALKQVKANIPPSLWERLESRLGHGNEMSFREKLLHLEKDHARVFGAIKEVEKDYKKIVEQRNHYVHAIGPSRFNIDEIIDMTQFLRRRVMTGLGSRLGLSDKTIRAVLDGWSVKSFRA